MSLDLLLSKWSTITRRTQNDAETDEYGNPTFDPDTDRVLCYFEPFTTSRTAGTEEIIDRATTIDEWRYVVAASVDLTSVDSVAIDGETGTFEVSGEPVNVWNPRRATTGQKEARLRRAQR